MQDPFLCLFSLFLDMLTERVIFGGAGERWISFFVRCLLSPRVEMQECSLALFCVTTGNKHSKEQSESREKAGVRRAHDARTNSYVGCYWRIFGAKFLVTQQKCDRHARPPDNKAQKKRARARRSALGRFKGASRALQRRFNVASNFKLQMQRQATVGRPSGDGRPPATAPRPCFLI